MKKFIYLLIMGIASLAMVSCGGGGGGGSSPSVNMKVTALKNQQAVASLPKSNAVDRMWAFLSAKTANAAHQPSDCPDSNKIFLLSGGAGTGAKVCLKTAYVVFNEIELEQESPPTGSPDELELGPFVVDLIGIPNDGIPGNIPVSVPTGKFDKIKFKIDDLDDKDNNGQLNGNDDIPKNVSVANVPAGLVGRSLLITGSATDGTGAHKEFTFKTDIEARITVPFTASVLDGSTLITFFDLSTGFSNLAFTNITPTMDALFNNVKCSDAGLDASHKLACDIAKNINLFQDVNNDDIAENTEKEGDDKGAGGFDDSIPHD